MIFRGNQLLFGQKERRKRREKIFSMVEYRCSFLRMLYPLLLSFFMRYTFRFRRRTSSRLLRSHPCLGVSRSIEDVPWSRFPFVAAERKAGRTDAAPSTRSTSLTRPFPPQVTRSQMQIVDFPLTSRSLARSSSGPRHCCLFLPPFFPAFGRPKD